MDPEILQQVRQVLGNRPRRRDLLIEHLHLFQDKYGFITTKQLVALSHEMKMAMAEVYEVASFTHTLISYGTVRTNCRQLLYVSVTA